MFALKDKNIVITGGSGFLGKYLVKEVESKRPKSILKPRRSLDDLRVWENCVRVVNGANVIVHAAGNVGGIGYNREKPGELFYDNLLMGVQLMEAARVEGVKKFVALGTVCAYPKLAPIPFHEDDLWNGYPEETNAPYGLAKKMLLVQSQAYREQYGFNSIYLIPVNLYGPGDHFEESKSHVIPALIKKVVDAKKTALKAIDVWGSGKATREFLYVEDAARGIVLATENYDHPEPVNLGSGMEISIAELVTIICTIVGFEGTINWDKTKPDGQPRRRLDVSKAENEFGFKAKVDFEDGLKQTIDWYTSSNENSN